MLYIFVSILAGVSIVVARVINSNLAKIIGIFQGTFFNYVIGLFFSFVFFILNKEFLYIPNVRFSSIPIWAYSGGLLGVLVVLLSSYVTPKISAFYLTLFIFISQLFIGIFIDYFTLDGLSVGKIIGGFLVLLGLTYNLLIDKKHEMKTDSEQLIASTSEFIND